MKMIVEQIVAVDDKASTVTKVQLSAQNVDILPVAIGDDLWFANLEDGGKRTRLIVLNIRMAFCDYAVYAILDVITPELANNHGADYRKNGGRQRITPEVYQKHFADQVTVETPAPQEVVLEREVAS